MACAEISNLKATPTIMPNQMAMQHLPMTHFSDMVNSVNGDKELLEHRHLTTNPKICSTWMHLYSNKIGWLAQGMPSHNTGINRIFFIQKPRYQKTELRM